jgi:hypothetical protein
MENRTPIAEELGSLRSGLSLLTPSLADLEKKQKKSENHGRFQQSPSRSRRGSIRDSASSRRHAFNCRAAADAAAVKQLTF